MAVNRDSTGYIVGFSVVVCAAFSILLSFVNSSLSERQEINAKNYLYFNILKVVGLKVYKDDAHQVKIGPKEIQELYKENITEVVLDEKGAVVTKFKVKGQEKDASFVNMDKEMKKAKNYRPIFMLKDKSGNVLKYAIPISGGGLWGPMYGFFAFNADCNTVSGITFYAHIETPGLGAEVEQPWFQDQFNNPEKPLLLRKSSGELTDVLLIKGGVDAKYSDPTNPKRKHAVDAISGATLTSNGLNKFINADLRAYESIFTGAKYKELQANKK